MDKQSGLTGREMLQIAINVAIEFGAECFYITDGSGIGWIRDCRIRSGACEGGSERFWSDVWDGSITSTSDPDLQRMVGGCWINRAYTIEDCPCMYEAEKEHNRNQQDYLAALKGELAAATERKQKGLDVVNPPRECSGGTGDEEGWDDEE